MIDELASSCQRRWLPEGDGPPRVIVCEQTGRWAVALGRQLGPSGPRLHQTRSLAECWEMLAGATASFVIVEASRANFEALLDRVARSGRQYPLARVAVVADRGLAAAEWLLREAGAACFVTSPRRLRPLAQVACRHLAQAPRPPRTFTQQVWAELPWG